MTVNPTRSIDLLNQTTTFVFELLAKNRVNFHCTTVRINYHRFEEWFLQHLWCSWEESLHKIKRPNLFKPLVELHKMKLIRSTNSGAKCMASNQIWRYCLEARVERKSLGTAKKLIINSTWTIQWESECRLWQEE